MVKTLLRASLFALSASVFGADAAEPIRSLGPDLAYWRVHQLPADLPPSGDRAALALIADLRFARATDEGAAAFATWLRTRARPATPVYVLFNAETDATLRSRMAPRELGPGIVTFAPAGTISMADIVVSVSALEDRTAYEALVPGKAIAELVTATVDKPRNDEAAIARKLTEKTVEPAPARGGARGEPPAANGRNGRGSPTAAESARGGGRGGRGGPPPAPPLDLVLQRAVQVHQGLSALGRIR